MMEISYVVTLNYPDDGLSEDEPSPEIEDIVNWVVKGMADEGLASADVTCART